METENENIIYLKEEFYMKKFLLGLLFSSMVALTACTPASEPTQEATDVAEETTESETRTVTDQNGDEIVLPNEINRVVITSPWPLPSVYGLYMGSGERIVGIHPAAQGAAENSLLMRIAPEIAEAETGFINGTEINIEELMKLEPDVVFYPAGNDEQKAALANAGIPAVAFSTSIAQFNTVETVNRWVELLGEIFGDEVKADEITAYGRDIENMILERIKDIPEEEKPRALIMYHYKDDNMQTSGAKHFGQYWLDMAGAINVAGDQDAGGVPISMEQINEWNPDILFVTNFSPYLVEDFYKNAIEGDDWSSIKAVQDEKVFKYPLGMYRWYPPSSDSPLTLLWLVKQVHPDLFKDIDLEQEIRDYYTRFYNLELTDEDIVTMMNPPREAADGV